MTDRLLTASILSAALALSAAPADAQEDVLGPPEVLEYPFEAEPSAPRAVAGPFFRLAVERGADVALCEALMRAADRPIPAAFDEDDCEPEFREQVRNNEGVVHWAAGDARPLKCGAECVGRPFMTGTQLIDQPNVRRAKLFGRLKFIIDPPGPINRTVTYGYEAFFTCRAESGARTGEMTVSLVFGRPVLGEPGPLESALDFFLLPADLSRRIESRIRRDLASVGGTSSTEGPCASVGVSRALDPLFDEIRYDPPPNPRAALTAGFAVGDRATVRLLRLTRKPPPPLAPTTDPASDDPAASSFAIYVNGAGANLPPPVPGGSLLLPPGGSVPLNLCKTVSLSGNERLQIILTNGLGGAVWSQFPRSAKFGAGQPRTMTTGRTVVVPGVPGPPDPLTGKPAPTKPQSLTLREFELLYDITFQPKPDKVAPVPPSTKPGFKPPVAGGKPGGGVAVDPSKPPPEPCREI